jgi:sulfopyruvate decarboxylase subunit beta
MNRLEVAELLAPYQRNAAVFTGPGFGSSAIAKHNDHALMLFNMEMAYVTATALGVALGWPSLKVFSCEGDGSVLMGQSALTTVGRCKPANLIIVVFDNGCYLTTGSGTATSATTTGTDIEMLARGAGIAKTATVRTTDEARAAFERACREPGPWLIVTKIDTSDRAVIMKNAVPFPTDCFESGQRFRHAALKMGAPDAPPEWSRLPSW